MKKAKVLGVSLAVIVIALGLLSIPGASMRAGRPLTDLHSCEFQFFDWNVHGMSSSFPFRSRLESGIFEWLAYNSYDVLNIQEDFAGHLCDQNENFQHVYPTSLHHYSSSTILKDSGLTEFSNYNVRDFDSFEWSTSSLFWGFDSVATKGVSVVVYYLPVVDVSETTYEFPVHVYNVHLDGGRTQADLNARIAQIAELEDFMDEHSSGLPVIVSGDFNLYWADTTEHQVIADFMADQGLTLGNNVETDPYEYTNGNGTIDYVFYRNGTDTRENLSKIDFSVLTSVVSGSDHYPLLANFQYQADIDQYPDLEVTDILSFSYNNEGYPTDNMGYAVAQVRNNGPAATTRTVPIYGTIGTIKNYYAIGNCPPLASGQTATVTIEFLSVPIPTSWTSAEVYLTVDRNQYYNTFIYRCGNVKENNERNNCRHEWMTIQYME